MVNKKQRNKKKSCFQQLQIWVKYPFQEMRHNANSICYEHGFSHYKRLHKVVYYWKLWVVATCVTLWPQYHILISQKTYAIQHLPMILVRTMECFIHLIIITCHLHEHHFWFIDVLHWYVCVSNELRRWLFSASSHDDWFV